MASSLYEEKNFCPHGRPHFCDPEVFGSGIFDEFSCVEDKLSCNARNLQELHALTEGCDAPMRSACIPNSEFGRGEPRGNSCIGQEARKERALSAIRWLGETEQQENRLDRERVALRDLGNVKKSLAECQERAKAVQVAEAAKAVAVPTKKPLSLLTQIDKDIVMTEVYKTVSAPGKDEILLVVPVPLAFGDVNPGDIQPDDKLGKWIREHCPDAKGEEVGIGISTVECRGIPSVSKGGGGGASNVVCVVKLTWKSDAGKASAEKVAADLTQQGAFEVKQCGSIVGEPCPAYCHAQDGKCAVGRLVRTPLLKECKCTAGGCQPVINKAGKRTGQFYCELASGPDSVA